MRNTNFNYTDNDGMLVLHNAKTLDIYHKIRETHPKGTELGFFWAFSNEQFHEGYGMLVERGFIKNGDKIQRAPINGLFGTEKGLNDMLNFYDNRDKEIAEKCDPCEVYAYENNNHESCINFDGDREAWKIVCKIFGKERCEKEVTRIYIY